MPRSFLCVLLVFELGRAVAGQGPSVPFLEPPPGWSDVTARTRARGVLLAFQGPESSSFVLARTPPLPLDNPAATRSYLTSVLDGVRAGARRDYRSSGRIETRTFANGVTAYLLRAELDGAPRLVLAVLDAGGVPLLATLSSGAPEAMLAPLFGGINADPGARQTQGTARSLDGQLEISLGDGLSARALSAQEKGSGAVLALQDARAQAIFSRWPADAASAQERSYGVRVAAAEAAKTPVSEASETRMSATPAGPMAVYSWARAADGARVAAGFLPWGYWSYSVQARGPQADEFLAGVFAALRQGPAAAPGLVAVSPRPEAWRQRWGHRAVQAAAALLAVLIPALLLWSRGREKR